MPITIKTVKLPSPGPNDQGATPPKTWIEQERPQPDYAAPSNTRDPRDNAKDIQGLDPAEARNYPGSGVPGEPFTRFPSPAPRRLRRDA